MHWGIFHYTPGNVKLALMSQYACCHMSFLIVTIVGNMNEFLRFTSRPILTPKMKFIGPMVLTGESPTKFFPPMWARQKILFLFCFPPTRTKKTVSELVDQTIYWVWPNQSILELRSFLMPLKTNCRPIKNLTLYVKCIWSYLLQCWITSIIPLFQTLECIAL